MPRVDLKLGVDIERTPRVVQLESMFDVPEEKRRTVAFDFDVPLDEHDWQIGLIVGPSGAGKSSVARHLFGDHIVDEYDWPDRQSVIDGFGGIGIRDATAALSSVGFSAPPSWMKPYSVLSNGERFRANMARALVDEAPLVVVDEFTSVVDRTVAKVGSHAIAKAVRKTPGKQFVAVSCHDDIIEWLQPDWVLEPHVGRFRWRSLRRRPSIDVEVVRVDHQAWEWFAPHHYLTAAHSKSARCFAGLLDGRPVAFSSIMSQPNPHIRNAWRLHRLVVLPDFQGVGIGHVLSEAVAAIATSNGRAVYRTTSHPALSYACARSTRWRLRSHSMTRYSGRSATIDANTREKGKPRRRMASFRWIGGQWHDPDEARRMWANPSKGSESRLAADGTTEVSAP